MARYCNDYAAQMVKDHPGKFGRFVALPLPDLDGSLAEIAYGLDTLKCDGVGVLTSYGNTWWGDPKFAPVYEELNRRGTVVFVHPTSPQCCTNLLPGVSDADIEYGTDTTRAIAAMIFNGTSTKYPRMRTIWSHAGGTMPFLDWRFTREGERAKYKSFLPNGYLPEAQKFYYDTAQAAIAPPMLALSKLIPLSHILFGTDIPYLTLMECVQGMHDCGVFTAAQLNQIGRTNTVALLGA
jgi:predicted TIM-barrel fold metal-dependent hydrolase